MSNSKRTKIIATLGPSSNSPEVMEKLILEGVDVFRINFSHANYKDASKRISLIRKLSAKLNIHVSILADLQGPKLTIGEIKKKL